MRIQNCIIGMTAASVAVFLTACSSQVESNPETPAPEEAVAAVEEVADAVEAVAVPVPEGFEAIESSLVKGAKYDAATETLSLVLAGGKTYEYTGVAQKLFDDLMTADSKGSFYRENIKGKFGAAE